MFVCPHLFEVVTELFTSHLRRFILFNMNPILSACLVFLKTLYSVCHFLQADNRRIFFCSQVVQVNFRFVWWCCKFNLKKFRPFLQLLLIAGNRIPCGIMMADRKNFLFRLVSSFLPVCILVTSFPLNLLFQITNDIFNEYSVVGSS